MTDLRSDLLAFCAHLEKRGFFMVNKGADFVDEYLSGRLSDAPESTEAREDYRDTTCPLCNGVGSITNYTGGGTSETGICEVCDGSGAITRAEYPNVLRFMTPDVFDPFKETPE